MAMTEALDQSQPGLWLRLQREIQSRRLNARTEQTYLHWITRFVLFHGLRDPAELESGHIEQFVQDQKERMRVSRARLNQAMQALTFFYVEVLKRPAVVDPEASDNPHSVSA
ncbi:site-specific integrase [Marinobacteraceae bacterium S3BR75-40.1]